MDELKDLLSDILDELRQINTKLDKIDGVFSLDDVCDKIDDLSTSMDIHSNNVVGKLTEIQGGIANNTLHDICTILDDIENNTSRI